MGVPKEPGNDPPNLGGWALMHLPLKSTKLEVLKVWGPCQIQFLGKRIDSLRESIRIANQNALVQSFCCEKLLNK